MDTQTALIEKLKTVGKDCSVGTGIRRPAVGGGIRRGGV
jgi:hypothetical protein